MSVAPDVPDAAANAALRARLAVVLWELDFLTALAAARGQGVTLDMVERESRYAPGARYDTVIDTGCVT